MGEYKETAVASIQKAELAYLNRNGDGLGYTEFIIKQLSAQLAERIMTVLSNEGEVVVRLSDLRVEEYMPTNSVEYRRQITWSSLVRCKDCKYGHSLTDTNGYNYRTCNYPWGHGMMVEEYGFCKWGERREDDT